MTISFEHSSETAAMQKMQTFIKDAAVAPIDKYLRLRSLQKDNPRLFYFLLMSHTEEMLPFLYTPTVGEACQRYHQLPIPTYGLYISYTDKGNIFSKLQALPHQDISVIVVTDGERILGLGDLGAGGMGISEGKSLLYTAAAGVFPSSILPICLDIGTNNKTLLQDPNYKGLRQPRVGKVEYDAFLEEFISALKAWRPHLVLQFEDFANHMAFHLLDKYRNDICCFNDDIQGTACIMLAGLLSALRATKSPLIDQKVLFLGAGEAGTGIGELISIAIQKRHGVSIEEARAHCYFMDSKGLVCASRTNLQHHKLPFAHDIEPCTSLLEAIHRIKPTVLVGVSTSKGAFTEEIIKAMAEINKRPIIMPLSNPTSLSECTYEEAFDGTQGKVLFASGSPFAPIVRNGSLYSPAQANNAYVFPAIGHAAMLCQAKSISDGMFLIAAEALAEMTTLDELEKGFLFPRFSSIRRVSAHLMGAIAQRICAQGMGTAPKNFDAVTSGVAVPAGKDAVQARWEAYAAAHMFDPSTSPRL